MIMILDDLESMLERCTG